MDIDTHEREITARAIFQVIPALHLRDTKTGKVSDSGKYHYLHLLSVTEFIRLKSNTSD
jgi:hypothetical protein